MHARALLRHGEIAGQTETGRALKPVEPVEHRERRPIPRVGDLAVAEQGSRVHRARTPPMRWWLAHEGGEPCGYFSSWEGVAGMGHVEDLFVHPDRRHRGIATALVHHVVADARAHGAGPVSLIVDPDDTPRHMYATMGFRPLAEKRDLLHRA